MKPWFLLLAGLLAGLALPFPVLSGQQPAPDPATPVASTEQQQPSPAAQKPKKSKQKSRPAPTSFRPSERIDADTEIAFPPDI